MNNEIIAGRYATAIYEIAKEKNEQATFGEQIQMISEILSSDAIIMTVMEHPKVSKDKKKAIVAEIVKEVSPMVSNLLHMLVDNGRLSIFPALAKAYTDLRNEEEGVMDAIAYTAAPLSEEEIAQLNTVFAPKVGKKALSITSVVDPAVLGGVKLQIENVIYDGSLREQLQRLERQLITNRI